MSIGVGELLLVLVIVFVLFGAGKLPQVMNDLGKGIRNLKKGLKEDQKEKELVIEQEAVSPKVAIKKKAVTKSKKQS